MLILCKTTPQALNSGILPPNSAVICYITEEALLISAHLSTEIAAISFTLFVASVNLQIVKYNDYYNNIA